MARIQPNEDAEEFGSLSAGRRKAVRYAVPVAVVGLAAATIGFVPAFAGSDDSELPTVSAEELITKIAASDTQTISGTVRIDTDLGFPSLPGGASFGGGGARGGEGGASAADPSAKLMELASGSHTLRVAADGHEKHRLSIIDDAAEYSVIHNGKDMWAYDSGTDSAYHASAQDERGAKKAPGGQDMPKELGNASPQGLARQALKAVDETTSVSVDGTATVAGRDTYQLLIKPKQAGSTVGSIRIAVDAGNGVPLKVTLTPKSGGKAVLDAGFTSVDFAKPDAKTFEFSPPKGTKVTEQSEAEKKAGPDARRKLPFIGAGASGLKVIGEGWTTVARISTAKGGSASGDTAKDGSMPPEAKNLIDSLGDKVSGKFGSGTVFSTRLVNVLMTQDGALYAGAVNKDTLVKAAEAAK